MVLSRDGIVTLVVSVAKFTVNARLCLCFINREQPEARLNLLATMSGLLQTSLTQIASCKNHLFTHN